MAPLSHRVSIGKLLIFCVQASLSIASIHGFHRAWLATRRRWKSRIVESQRNISWLGWRCQLVGCWVALGQTAFPPLKFHGRTVRIYFIMILIMRKWSLVGVFFGPNHAHPVRDIRVDLKELSLRAFPSSPLFTERNKNLFQPASDLFQCILLIAHNNLGGA